MAAALSLLTSFAQPIGQWEFDDPANRLKATVGTDLAYSDGAAGATATGTAFGTASSFGLPSVAGTDAVVMRFPAAVDGTMGYNMLFTAPPNGGSLVNNWTIIMDILYPLASDNRIRSLMETDGRVENVDADFKINAANAVGALVFHGSFPANRWNRLALVVDRGQGVIRKYLNGVELGREPAGPIDGRWALDPVRGAQLFTDNNGETAIGYVASIQLRDVALNSGQIMALGGAAGAGIPTAIPTVPAFVETRSPDANAVNIAAKPAVRVTLNPGDSTIPEDSIRLLLDGTALPIDLLNILEGTTTYEILAQVTDFLEPSSQHTLTVEYSESGTARTSSWRFTVVNYQKIQLPAPIVLETFDGIEEGGIPDGWTRTNRTTTVNAGINYGDPESDAYLDWITMTTDRMRTIHGANRVQIPAISLNGTFLTALSEGNLLYAESDSRGGEQVQALFSKDYDMTGHNNVFVVFHSLYAQNQDNMNCIEYSIDEGATWHPLLYMVNGRADNSDIIRLANGTIDAVATLGTARTDQAWDAAYAAYIGAPLTQALAPFISPRIDDDQNESKRIEVLRMPLADNQAKVRLRFMQAGTGSWYWGVDNLGFYSINTPVIGTQPSSYTVDAGQNVTFTVAATGPGTLSYQWQFNGNNIEGQTGTTLQVNNVTPDNAGQYRVIVTNADGPTTSASGTLTVIAAPQITTQPLGGIVSASGTQTFTVAARGGLPMTYQWQKDGQELPGQTSATLTINPVVAESAGYYRVVISNSYGSTESAVARLNVTSGEITANLVGHFKFDGNATDSSGRNNNGTLASQTEATPLATFDGGGAQLIGTHAMHALDGQHVQLGRPDDFLFGADTSFTISFWFKAAAGGLTGDPSFIGNKHWTSGGNPGFVVAAQGDGGWKWNWKGNDPSSPRRDTANLGVLTDGNWHNVVVSHDRTTVATFFVDGVLKATIPIVGDATIDHPTYGLNILQDGTEHYGFANDTGAHFLNVFMDDMGIWRRALTPQEASSIHTKGRQGQDLTTATFTGVERPVISVSPANVTAYENFRARFTVTAAGTPPLTYQWYNGVTAIDGATGATYTIDNVTAANQGSYSVVVSNAGGSTPSGAATLTVVAPPATEVTGQWDFNDGTLNATVGAAMQFRGDTAGSTTFPTVTIGGQQARVMGFPATTATQGYIVQHGAAPNGGGQYVNNYTLIYDVMFPQESNNRWRTFWQTSEANANDGDLFVNTSNGIGISGNYTGTIVPETWHRVVFTINSTDSLITKYIDGVRVGQQNGTGIDGRFSLGTTAMVFTDNDGDTAPGFANSIQFRNWVMTDAAVAALGGATADGIPGVVTRPTLGATLGQTGLTITVSGTGTFQLQRKTLLTDPQWENVGAAGPGPFTVPTAGSTGFFQVIKTQ